MNTKAAVCLVLAINMASGSLAIAQGRGDRGDRRDEQAQRRDHDRRDGNRHDMGRRGPPSWANNRHDRFPDGSRRWQRGDRLPPEYRDRQYVVSDWRGHRLDAPPRGHQWVQSGSDYLLVAIATGVIAQLLLNR